MSTLLLCIMLRGSAQALPDWVWRYAIVWVVLEPAAFMFMAGVWKGILGETV